MTVYKYSSVLAPYLVDDCVSVSSAAPKRLQSNVLKCPVLSETFRYHDVPVIVVPAAP